ncbi:unnamed protein product [Rotaria sp. Silwood1]|nr:unnamed protein product [Rotaria sp. Silwood1]
MTWNIQFVEDHLANHISIAFSHDSLEEFLSCAKVAFNKDMIETDSIHRQRRVQSPSSQHRHSSVTSSSQPDTLKAGLPIEEVALKRHLGLFSGVCFIVGIIIGSGIFISPQGVLKGTHSVGLCLIVWAACGLLALLGALCYAEIGTVIPRNGAEVASGIFEVLLMNHLIWIYSPIGIGSVHERTGDILAYLFNWTNASILRPASVAVLAITFSRYFLLGIMDDCGPPSELVKILAIFTTIMLMNINSLSVSASNRLNIVFVICKVSTILTVIVAGLVRIGQGTGKNLSGLAYAFYLGLWSYDGWNSLNTVTEELKNPQRNLWLSIVLALPAVTVLYVLTNVSYFTVLSKAALLSSSAVAVTWGEVVLGPVVRALLILIAISALGSANGTLFAAARYCMVGAQYGYLPEVFACIHSKRLTPLPGIVLQGCIGIIFCLQSDIEELIEIFSFAAWIFYGLTFVATLCCKFTKKDAKRVINVPIPLVVIVILISLYLVIAPLIYSPSSQLLYTPIIMLVGLIFYYPFVYRKIELNIIIESDSIYRHRPGQSPITEHRHVPITSIVQTDPLKAVLLQDEPTLKRHLGLFSGICFIIGAIIGAGIFISPKGVLQETQSVGLCLIIWAACGLISILGALCYAEIGTVIPRNGAEIAYLKEDCDPSPELIKMLAIFAILMLININSLSVSAANRLNIVFVICKVFTILTVIIVGLIRIGQGHTQNLQNSFAVTTKKPFGVALAFYKGLFAYGGWQGLNTVTEELKNPKRNLWLSIVLAVPCVIILYILTNISYFTVMNKAELLSSNAVAVTWGKVALGPAVRALVILISISALGTANLSLFAAARYCMVGAQYGYLPELFTYVQTQRLTPLPGVVFMVVFSI